MTLNKYKRIVVIILTCVCISSGIAQVTIDPMLNDVWGGVNCKDDNGSTINVSNYYTPNNSSPGCVAISMSQILHYYQWPKYGVGNNVYSDDYDGVLKRHSAFFDKEAYDWENMLNEYHSKPSSEEQRKAIGKLMYDTGAALQMDYEPTGSTSNINKTPFIYQNFFKFSGQYQDKDWSEFWNKLDANIQEGHPVPVAVDASRTGDGHVFIVDGYKEESGEILYHLNWGWYNDNNINGWYNIREWTTDSPGYNTITGAVFDLIPNPEITVIEKTGTGNDFTISWETSKILNWEAFTLEQKVDQGLWETVATDINAKTYTINNPAGKVYQFRVKAKVNGKYYDNSWSEIMLHQTTGQYNGYVSFGGSQYAYARQTPNIDIDFTSEYTFETWIRLNAGNVDANVILNQKGIFSLEISDVTTQEYAIKFKSLSNGMELTSIKNNLKISVGEWAHIAVSRNDGRTLLFVNGIIADSNEGDNFELIVSNNALNIAEKYDAGYSSHLIADIDQLRISSIGRFTKNFAANRITNYTVDDNTIAYFTFDEIHKVRFKDLQHNLSVIAKNELGHALWKFEHLIIPDDSDKDGVPDSSDLCPNTIAGTTVDITGCAVFSLPADNFILKTTGTSCIDTNNGSINIRAIKNQNYTATLIGTDFNKNSAFTDQYNFSNLTIGDYELCITIAGNATYQQCFNVFISEPQALEVSSKIDSKNKKVTLFLSGASRYNIQLNDSLISTDKNRITLKLPSKQNTIKVSTDKNCQGEFVKNINLEDIIIYPNPVMDGNLYVQLKDFSTAESMEVRVFSNNGKQMFFKKYNAPLSNAEIDITKFPKGIYFISIKANNNSITRKIIKG